MVGGNGHAKTEIKTGSYFLGNLLVRGYFGGGCWAEVCGYYSGGKDGERVVRGCFGDCGCLDMIR